MINPCKLLILGNFQERNKMKPSPYDAVTIKNVDDEDFTFVYDKVKGYYPHTIKAREIKTLPRFLAVHAVKHLVDKILIKRKVRVSNLPARQNLAEMIVIHEEVLQQDPIKSEAEKMQEDINRMNAPSELDSILKKRRENGEPLPEDMSDIDEIIGTKKSQSPLEETKPEPVEVPKTVEKKEVFEQLEEEEKEVEEDSVISEQKKPVENKAVNLPTKDELKNYAVEEVGMTMDDKLKVKFDNMSEAELVKELQYPLERKLQ